MSIEPLWRATILFRVVALVFAAVIVGVNVDDYQRIGLAWTVIGVMALWTLCTGIAYARPLSRSIRFVVADIAVTGVLQYASIYALTETQLHSSFPTLTTVWTWRCAPPSAFAASVAPPSVAVPRVSSHWTVTVQIPATQDTCPQTVWSFTASLVMPSLSAEIQRRMSSVANVPPAAAVHRPAAPAAVSRSCATPTFPCARATCAGVIPALLVARGSAPASRSARAAAAEPSSAA